jgi:hypothetical protein
MRAIYLAPAVLLTALAVSPVSAAPAAHVNGASSSSIILAQAHRDDHRGPRYTPGKRYKTAPRGWHRYSRRPGGTPRGLERARLRAGRTGLVLPVTSRSLKLKSPGASRGFFVDD